MGILRVLLAIAVVAEHAHLFPEHLMIPGQFAVELFFIISGFYMALVLSTKYVGGKALWAFYSNRYLRLYPAYLTVCLLTWLWYGLYWRTHGALPVNNWEAAYASMDFLPKLWLVFSNWTMLGNELHCNFFYSPEAGFTSALLPGPKPEGAVWAGDFGTIPPGWSIGVELWFYLCAPWLNRLKTLPLSLVGVLSFALKALLSSWHVSLYFVFPCYLWIFIAGMLAYRLGIWLKKTSALSAKVGWVSIALFALVIVFYAKGALPGQRYLFYTLFVLALPFAFHASKNQALDRWIGNISYPVYLSHMLILQVMEYVVPAQAVAPLTLVCTLVMSVLLVLLIENPLDHWRQNRALKARQVG